MTTDLPSWPLYLHVHHRRCPPYETSADYIQSTAVIDRPSKNAYVLRPFITAQNPLNREAAQDL